MRQRYTRAALADLNAVLDYIAARSPQGARRVQTRIQTIIDLILSQPGMGTRTDEPEIRRMTTSPYPYLIFYQATGEEVVILAIRHAARNPSGMPGGSAPH